jgi:hypothetical protein
MNTVPRTVETSQPRRAVPEKANPSQDRRLFSTICVVVAMRAENA